MRKRKSRPLDRRAVMRDAHKRFRDGKRLDLGWSFAQCLATAWAAAKLKRKWEEEAAALKLAA